MFAALADLEICTRVAPSTIKASMIGPLCYDVKGCCVEEELTSAASQLEPVSSSNTMDERAKQGGAKVVEE
ncbi:hypothetical protein GUITHDRAFT_107701 [Guillardia theta CCMP2712]|uniref:Uncharacterized protein n=1 Tax=Guillardia theta (strain CCMP2712) TaxID=905079 RepID=L1JEF7_GUITC|nr:hypothetical protein GUITHDRAFT_107701 [Guillardia theta CCMP2712]EKX46495.1 hypothetical protein GUITHDRAFT_107701 [Guillardia theta CCMP2712]|eukprot:XP_005833475.1 hypothetical protein GUITHDRAFT_107701 [Guillardia theta CCMP2712]